MLHSGKRWVAGDEVVTNVGKQRARVLHLEGTAAQAGAEGKGGSGIVHPKHKPYDAWGPWCQPATGYAGRGAG